MIQPVILCGGSGTRLWPESRGVRAKQFLPLTGPESLFEQTIQRTPAGESFSPPIIICGAAHVPLVRDQLRGRPAELLVEPMPRNTAAAIALAVVRAGEDDLLLVMPSDHIIADVAAFHAAIAKGAELARKDWLVTFGIAPDRPDTGFGYIASGAAIGEGGFAVDRFVEKPDLAAAERMIAAGGHNWNAGIFLFRAGRMRDAMLVHCGAILAAADEAIAGAIRDGDALHADAMAFASAPADSIDYAVMEKDSQVAVVPVRMGWSDMGSWNAVHTATAGKDAAGNAASGDVLFQDCQGSLVRSGGKRVSLMGMRDIVVVVAGDDILVMPLARSQDIRSLAMARENENG